MVINRIPQQVLVVVLQHFSDVLLLVQCHHAKNRQHLQQLLVVEVVAVPAANLDAVVRASAEEVLRKVVDNQGLLDVAAEQPQVLHGLEALRDLALSLRLVSATMLAVEPVPNVSTMVDAIDNPVRVVLHGRREDDDLVVLTELSKKFVAVRSHHIEKVVLAVLKIIEQVLCLAIRVFIVCVHEMYQCLVKVKYKSILGIAKCFRWEVRRLDLRQLLDVVLNGVCVFLVVIWSREKLIDL